ncbi:tRNA lysidine(34) synthetase TilS [Acidocella sp. KAb 2-4]|uniref:tRNA lysidine(34) synthetase TilS n=1 Tax=Acidocella sp. KAb 2-4 TaxID=2885158 RepID=UPI001D073E2F|nr:tRNA lysidine(34) synthetase TilS [Acidocella sp. KAb 2-4]MCB5944892.1 tRNA lysidine(34) synthetase TilS [Acidocella sp. KAb 2-4]
MPVRAAFNAALARLGPFGAAPRLAVAVSGGADSTALALLTQEFCAVQGGRLLALIVDHGLRAESAAEAALTASRLSARGIACKILTLAGLPRGAGLQRAAREARYAALARAAFDAGYLHLLLGHHAADQEETVAMRAARGQGGLEGMSAWSAREQVLLLRPLLGIRPAELRDYLRRQGMAWVEDPSNQAEKFERVRIRQAGLGQAPADPAARVAREQAAAAFLARHALLRPEGFAVLDAAAAPPAALAALIRSLGGALYPPRQANLATLAARLRPATLGGVRIAPAGRLGPGWLLAREAAACAPPVAAGPGARWDGRFILRDAAPGMRLGALGAEAAMFRGYRGLPSLVLRAMPALRGGGGHILFPAPVWFSPQLPVTAYPFAA